MRKLRTSLLLLIPVFAAALAAPFVIAPASPAVADDPNSAANFKAPPGCPKVVPAEAANSWARMQAVCAGKTGSPSDLKAVIEAWKKAGIDEKGSVYVFGARSGGQKMTISRGNIATMKFHVNEIEGTSFDSAAIRKACNTKASGKYTDSDLDALQLSAECVNAAGDAYERYSNAVRCNNMYGSDCNNTIDQLYKCAGVNSPPPAEMRVKAKDRIKFAKTKADLLAAKASGALQFGATIGVVCYGHYILYTGGAGLDYEIMQMGNGGASPKLQSTPAFLNNGKPNDSRAFSMSVVDTLENYISAGKPPCSERSKSGPYYWYVNLP